MRARTKRTLVIWLIMATTLALIYGVDHIKALAAQCEAHPALCKD